MYNKEIWDNIVSAGKMEAKAKRRLSGYQARCTLKGWEFNLTLDWMLDKMMSGKCDQTGLSFDLTTKRGTFSPYTFSVDRKDNTKGYTIDNCQAVIWMYNAAKGTGTDGDVMLMMDALLRTHIAHKEEAKSLGWWSPYASIIEKNTQQLRRGKRQAFHQTKFRVCQVD